jgi:hypothetical protein
MYIRKVIIKNNHMQYTTQITHITKTAVAATVVTIMVFWLMEPAVLRSAPATDNETFTIHQTITDEISLAVASSSLNMSGPIGGLLGGTATGTNEVYVQSNKGYTLDIRFSGSPAMRGDNLNSDSIRDYDPATANPDFNFIASTSATFAYTVASSPSADLVGAFLDNSSACGTGGTTYTANRCWQGPSTSDYTVVSRALSTGDSAATTTFTFVVNVPNGPVPSVPADFYTATATLTATTQ